MRTFTPEEVIGLVRLDRVTELSLDHDLGLDDGESERTGYTVLLWLEMEDGTGRWTSPIPEITIHTGNPVGRARMVRVLRTITGSRRWQPRELTRMDRPRRNSPVFAGPEPRRANRSQFRREA